MEQLRHKGVLLNDIILGAIELRKEDYRLMINGLVDKELVFTYEDLERFPREQHVYFCECAANTGMEWAGAQLNGVQFTHGMIHNMEYTGVASQNATQ